MTQLQQTGGNQVDPNQTVNIAARRQQNDAAPPPRDPNNPQAQTQAGLPNGAQPAVNADGTSVQSQPRPESRPSRPPR